MKRYGLKKFCCQSVAGVMDTFIVVVKVMVITEKLSISLARFKVLNVWEI